MIKVLSASVYHFLCLSIILIYWINCVCAFDNFMYKFTGKNL